MPFLLRDTKRQGWLLSRCIDCYCVSKIRVMSSLQEFSLGQDISDERMPLRKGKIMHSYHYTRLVHCYIVFLRKHTANGG